MAEEIITEGLARVPMLDQWAAVVVMTALGSLAVSFAAFIFVALRAIRGISDLASALRESNAGLNQATTRISQRIDALSEKVDSAHRASDRKGMEQLAALDGVHASIEATRDSIERMFEDFPAKLFKAAESEYPLDPNNPDHVANPRSRWNSLPAKE